jgi:glycosyltransferase involved in cell wall biosynthesis
MNKLKSLEKSISVVVPVYNAQHTLKELVTRLNDSLSAENLVYEIILIDDSSPDKSWEKILELTKTNKAVKGYRLSRNFGQHYAITAGLSKVTMNLVVVMDCDLQDRPEEIRTMLPRMTDDIDIVLGQRTNRKDSLFKRLFSFMFFKFLSYLSGIRFDPSVGNFGIYRRKVVDAILNCRESIRFFPASVQWVGFRSIKIPIQHAKREVGKSNYSLKKLIKLASDIILVFSDKPLKIMVKIGMMISFGAIVYALFIIRDYFQGKIGVLGYASLMVSIWFLSGVVILLIGVVGLYIGQTFEQTKRRPIFIISDEFKNETS